MSAPVRRLSRPLVIGSALLSLLSVGLVPASAERPLPVPYGFFTAAVPAGLNFNADPPGANDWACKPSAAHPRPIVLVHGLSGNKNTNWQTYAPLLKNNGYCVYALTYGVKGIPAVLNQFGGLNHIASSAAELKIFVNKVLSSTRATKVDVLGHSEGTFMPNYYIKFLGGATKIKNYISLASLWHGTNPAGLDTLLTLSTSLGIGPAITKAIEPYFASGPELLASSAMIKKMRSGGTPRVAGITYTNIVTKYDEVVQPYTSGIEPGMTNYVVQDFCPLDYSDHFQIAADPVAAALVLNTLDPKHPRPIPCRLVLPLIGGLT